MRRNLLIIFFTILNLTACQTLQVAENKVESNKVVSQTDIKPKKPIYDLPTTQQELTVVKLKPETHSPNNNVFIKPKIKYIQEKPLVKKDIWYRLRNGMNLPDIHNKRIQAQINFYAKHPEYLNRVVDRAEPYLHFILNEVEARNLPTEFALLPIVESAFQTYAYSHGRASGLWQIIPSTATYLKLKQNWWYDGRRDVYLSTKAALDYLDMLTKQFEGDSVLALASYNAGPGTIRRARRHNQTKNRPMDFWNLTKIRQETLNYVPKLYALKEIFKHPEKYGVKLRSIEDKPGFVITKIDQQIDIAKAASLAEISLDEFYKYNPAFNQWATSPTGSHYILLPVGKKAMFEQKYASLPASERTNWIRHKIKKNETLGSIALKYNSRVSLITQVNKIRNNLIREGKYLMIPTSAKALSSYNQSNAQRTAKVQNKSRGQSKTNHIVKSGDNLWSISRKYKVSHKSLAKWNAMAPNDTLSIGKKLVIWNKTSAPIRSSTSTAFAAPKSQMTSVRYTVRKGDSVALIASKFNVNISDIKKWNRIGKYIQPGQKIKLWVDVTSQSS